MTITANIVPFEQVFGLDGKPLDNGKIYIGTVNQDPQYNQVQVYWDEAGTITAAQPIRTVAGYISYNGAPARIYVNGNYSLRVSTKNDQQVYYVPDCLMIGNQSALTPVTGVSIVATYAAMRLYNGSAALVYVAGHTDDQDGAAGNFAVDESDTTSADNGGTILVDSLGRRWKRQFTSHVNVKWFGAKGDGVANDTTPIQNAINAYITGQLPYPNSGDVEVCLPKGRYLVTSLDVPSRVHMRFDGGVLAPFEFSTPRAYLIKFASYQHVYDISVDMDYALNYDTVIWCRGRYMDFVNPEIWRAKCSWVFGDPAWENSATDGSLGDSEITITGGTTNWGVTVARFYGQNTIVNFVGHKGYSYKWTLPDGDPRKAAWEALPEIGYVNVGAMVYLTGGFTGNYSGAQPNFESVIQPTNNPDYVNTYGKYICTGVHIESGFHFDCRDNGAVPIQDTVSKMLTMTGCKGYVSGGRTGYLIDGQNSTQGITIRDNNFYGNTGTNLVYAVSAKVDVDAQSYASVSGGVSQQTYARNIVGKDNFVMVNAHQSSQSFPPTQTTLLNPTISVCDYHPAVAPEIYNSNTGEVVIRQRTTGVEVSVGLAFVGGAVTDTTDFILNVNGSVTQIRQAIGGFPNLTFNIAKLNAGDILQIKVAQYQSRSADGSVGNYLFIKGSV